MLGLMLKGLRIQLLRHRHPDALTQVEAAARGGMSQSRWAKWEAGGHGEAAAQTLRAIAHALDVHPGELFDALPKDTLSPMQRNAADIAGSLQGEDLKQWLALGERLIRSSAPGKEPQPERGGAHSPAERRTRTAAK